MARRRSAATIAIIAMALVGCGATTGRPSPAAGPLGAGWPRLSLGHFLTEGQLFTDNQTWGLPNDSGAQITLDAVSLMNPSPGLSLVGAVVITDLPLEMEPHAPGFPAPTGLPSVPVAGYRVPADGLLNLGLGLRIDDPTAYQGFEGVLIDYALDGRHYRATLAYRS